VKICIVMGARKKGNTAQVVSCFTEALQERADVSFDYLYPADARPEHCVGCHNCIFTGEQHCPHHDTFRPMLQRLHEADAVILASPGYMFSVTGIMKTFLDHMAYLCHRPEFFGKKALVLSSCTRWQQKSVLTPMTTWAAGAGFTLAGKFFVEMPPLPLKEKELERTRRKIRKEAARFAAELQKPGKLKPVFADLMIFNAFRAFSRFAPGILKADYAYFQSLHAYDRNTRWYRPVKVSRIKSRLAGYLTGRIMKSLKKMVDPVKLQEPGVSPVNSLTDRS